MLGIVWFGQSAYIQNENLSYSDCEKKGLTRDCLEKRQSVVEHKLYFQVLKESDAFTQQHLLTIHFISINDGRL